VPKGQLEVHIIDVGQGDSIFIRGPEGQTMLIDGGSEGTGALQYLQGQSVDHLDLMLATHPHEDHIGGLPAILKAMPVARVVMNGQPTTTRIYERLLDAIATAKAEYQEVKRGDRIQLGSLTFDVLHPAVPTGPNLNNQSIVLRLIWGQVSFMLPGDAERETEGDILASGQPVAATILKLGHHGSRTATSSAWLKAISPTVAIYSAGVGNSYGHPHPETLAALSTAGVQVYGTDVSGTVVVTSDGAGYSVATAKGNGPRAPPAAPQPVSPPPDPPAVVPAHPEPTAAPAPSADLALQIVSVSSPVRPGVRATLTAQTVPGAQCSITVRYQSGPSSASGLEPKTADASGNISWSWTVGSNTTPGTWPITVTARLGGNSLTREISFVVAK
jgi:competence protein ComEC